MRTNIMRQGRLITASLQNLYFPTSRQKVLRILTLLLAALLLCYGAHASAQEVTLEQAIDLFYKNNYDILINRYEIDKAFGDLAAAKIIPNPNISVNYTGYTTGYARTDNTMQAYRLEQLIELGGKRGYRIKSATEGLEATKLSHKDTIRTLLIGFYTNYYNLVLDELNIDLATDELKRFDRVLEIGEKRHNAGFLSLIDYTKLKLARIELENSLTTFSNQYRNDLELFNLLLGGKDTYKPLKGQIKEDFPRYKEESLVETAYSNRFDLLALERQKQSIEFSQKLARAQRIPDLSVGMEYEALGTKLDSGLGGGLSMSIPLFYRNQGEILRRDAEYSQIRVQIEKVRRQIQTDIRQALNNYSSGLTIFDAYRKRKMEMEDLLQKSEQAFALGGITVLELLDTRKTYRDFITKYNQTLTQSVLNRDLLTIYTGQIAAGMKSGDTN
jgi:cobalt-zinc-cadmium efflux system outer membrane protein